MPPSSNWLRPYSYKVVALDLSKMRVRTPPEASIIVPIAQPDRATVF